MWGRGVVANLHTKIEDWLKKRNRPRQVALETHSNGYSGLQLASPNTKEQVWLYLLPASGPQVWLQDRFGKTRVTIGPDDNGLWQVGVWNADGRGRALEADR